ncbi:MFS transporter [Actinoplanes rectilineatus]|uniref:MFS transporter n=1 Tax=Actinoplanes rectilineatus TaxID=113571 RepID=UPI0005F28E95|nr:MFS transporter [Actinoplanes rectilineatus]
MTQLLRNRNAAVYLGAVLVSGFGSTAMILVAGVWVMSLTGSSSLAAAVGFLMYSPTLVAPLLGALVDRTPHRRAVLVGVNLAMGLILFGLLLVRSADQVWLIFVVMLLYGVSFVVLDAAETAVLPAAVDRELLGDVNGLRMSISEGVKLVAPLVGAGLFTIAGGAGVAVLDAVTFLSAAALCLMLRFHPRGYDRSVPPSAGGLRDYPALHRLVLCGAAVTFTSGVSGAMLFAVIKDGLGYAPAYAGVLSAVQGAGAIAGGLLAGPLQRRFRAQVFVGAAIALFALSLGLRAVPATVPVLASALLAGVSLPCVLIAIATTVQREVPTERLGRVAGAVNLFTFVPIAAGQALGAVLLSTVDRRIVLAAVAVVAASAAAVCLRPVRATVPSGT